MHFKLLTTKKYMHATFVMLGVFVATGISSFIQSEFENEIIDTIINKIDPKNDLSEEALIDSTIHLAHYIQESRTLLTGSHEFESLKTTFFSSTLESFYIGTGACGYYSLFAARLFKRMGFSPKIVQQKTGDVWGAHITVAIPLADGRLGLTDPLFNHVFKDKNGKIADIHSVINEWDYYQGKVPPIYDKKYDYQSGYRHTNWTKLGFISKGIYSIACMVFGKETMETVSIRVTFIDPYYVQAICCLIGSIGCLILLYFLNKKTT